MDTFLYGVQAHSLRKASTKLIYSSLERKNAKSTNKFGWDQDHGMFICIMLTI